MLLAFLAGVLLFGPPGLFHRIVLQLAGEYAGNYLNGRVAAGDYQVNFSNREILVRDLIGLDSDGNQLFRVEQVAVRLAGWTDLRPVAVSIDTPVFTVNLDDGAHGWLGFWKGTGETTAGPPELPERIAVNHGVLWLNSDTVSRRVEVEAEALTREYQTDLTLATRIEGGNALLHATYDLTASAVEQARLTGAYGGAFGATLTGDLDFDYGPDSGLVVQRAVVADGTDTIVGSGTWYGETAAITLTAENFDFGARYPELAGVRGEHLSVAFAGWRDRGDLAFEYRDRARRVNLIAVGSPDRNTIDRFELRGALPELGDFTAAGGVAWRPAAPGTAGPGTVAFEVVTVRAPRLALDGVAGTYNVGGEAGRVTVATAAYENFQAQGVAGEFARVRPDPSRRPAEPDRYTFQIGSGFAGGTVRLDGSYELVAGRGRATVAGAGLELAALNRAFRAELAGAGLTLEAGRLDGTVGVEWDRSWRAHSTAPLRVRGGAFRSATAGTFREVNAELGFTLAPGRASIRDGRFQLPAGEGTFAVELTGADYATLAGGRLAVAELDLKPLEGLLRKLCAPKAVLSQVQGKVGCDLRFATVSGRPSVGGVVRFADVAAQFSEPNIIVRKLAGELRVDTGLVHLPGMAGVKRADFEAGWARLAAPFTGDLTCRSVTLGAVKLSDLTMDLSVNWPRLRVNRARWQMFNGAAAAEGDVSFAGSGLFGLSVLVKGLSLKTVCATFPEINNYLEGKVDATLWLMGDGFTLERMTGNTDVWAYDDAEEKRLVHRELLVRIGGDAIARHPITQVETLPFVNGELTVRIEESKMNFEVLDLLVRNFLYTVDVNVAPNRSRIDILRFLKTINLITERGVAVQIGGAPAR